MTNTIATFQHQHANLFAALHPAPDQPHETLDAAAVPLPTTYGYIRIHKSHGRRIVTLITLSPDHDYVEGERCKSEADAEERADGMGVELVDAWTLDDMVAARRKAQSLPTVGSIVSVPKLGLRSVKVVEVVPSRHPLGETRYRVEWLGVRGATAGANFLVEDLQWGEGE